MALAKDSQKLVEKLTGKSYKDWEQEVCNKEGMELIQGKGEMRNNLLESKYGSLLEGYATKNLTKSAEPAKTNPLNKESHENKFTPNNIKK